MNRYFYLFIFSSVFSYSQSIEQRKAVIEKSDIPTLKQLSEQFRVAFLARQERVNRFLFSNPEVVARNSSDGVFEEIYDISPVGEIKYYKTYNDGAATTARATALYSGGSLGLNLQGQGMVAYVWDGGSARATHKEYPNGKVISADGSPQLEHAGHVMGTIVAQGIDARLRGIAFNASGVSYKWDDDLNEMATEAANGMLVSNHSYGPGENPRYLLGAYNSTARSFDNIASAAPYYLAVASAGNDRNDFFDDDLRPYLEEKGGYNLIKGMANAKNILTVGAVNQVSNYSSAVNVTMTAFSSFGPTDDGRIKPDLVTKGQNVRSTTVETDESNRILSGSSMASPGIAGVALLLQQYYYSLNDEFMRAATLKGLMLHTTDEAGDFEGPDYAFGWGLVNAERAASLIKSDNEAVAAIEELELVEGESYTKTIAASGSSPLLISISWTDRFGSANNSVVDPTKLDLVNDLDVRVTKGEEIFYPWTLNPVVPTDPAVRSSNNFRDNYEKVQIDNPNGAYTITISHKGVLGGGGKQKYSLIVSGPTVTLSAQDFAADKDVSSIFPNPTDSKLNIDSSTFSEITSVEILDISGKVIDKISDLNQKSIDVSKLNSGLYFVRFSTSDGIIVKKFIKK
jgi:hypothetical protein